MRTLASAAPRQRPAEAGPHRARIAAGIQAATTIILCVVIALVPLPFGSMSRRIIWAWVLVLSAIALLASLRRFDARDRLFLVGLSSLALLWAFVVAGQMTSNPFLFHSLRDPIWEQTSRALGAPLPATISVVRDQAFFAAGSQIACMLALACGFLLGRERAAAHAIVQTIAMSGLLYALYGIVAFVFWPDHWLWLERGNYRNSLIATFINPNVAAVYFGACAITWVLLLANTISLPVETKRRSIYQFLGAVLFNRPRPRTICYLCAVFVVLSAMFMTGSRAGSVISLMAISGAVATLCRQQLGFRGLVLVFPAIAIAAVLAIFEIFGSLVTQRFNSEGLFDSGRWNVYLSTIDMIKDHPWLGTGLGTFRWAFPAYRSGETSIIGIWEQAHSSPLELAAEMGILFGVFVSAAWGLAFTVLWRGILTRKRDQILPLAAFWAATIGILHSLIDFSLQVPGFSIMVFALMGMGLAQSSSSRSFTL